ncbi:hypothetical protein Tco_1172200, partial [Tanacetum coccineum]
LLSDEDFDDSLEPKSHKENLEKNDDNDDDDDQDDHALIRTRVSSSLKIRTKKMHIPIPSPYRSPRTDLSSYKTLDKELTVSVTPAPAAPSKVNESLKDIVPKLATSATNDISKDNLLRLVTDTVRKERESS